MTRFPIVSLFQYTITWKLNNEKLCILEVVILNRVNWRSILFVTKSWGKKKKMNLWIKYFFFFALYMKLMFFNFFMTVKYSKNILFFYIYIWIIVEVYYNVTKIQNRLIHSKNFQNYVITFILDKILSFYP